MAKQRAPHIPSSRTEQDRQSSPGTSLPGDDLSTPNQHSGKQNNSTTTEENRSGTDTRQRGWFWHWNGIVTQYSPLIGLKGVGLLNSYTVWTDRREQSPTRGYAFPGQQAEAAFYGEDRAELITINKILAALDLIEIRKEMVQKTDAQGRRWKVPHNLYRVKDRPDGLELRTEDVLRVAELAARDASVFRYVRRVFSERFVPIDRDNVWHRILEEVAGDPTWQKLAAKTARIEARASARTRAGHQARAGQTPRKETPSTEPDSVDHAMTSGHLKDGTLSNGQHAEGKQHRQQTSVASVNNGLHPIETSVAATNNGFDLDVATANNGLQGGEESSAETTNNGQASVVAPGNTTYYQEIPTTTTTTTGSETATGGDALHISGHSGTSARDDHAAIGGRYEVDLSAPAGSNGLDDNTTAVSTRTESGTIREGQRAVERGAAGTPGWGPLVDPSPLVVSIFEAANNRAASPLERILLGELERDAAAPAAATGETGADWVAAALREAVASGSTFVAPKRIQEIINRWAAEGGRPGVARTSAHETASSRDSSPVRLPRGRSAGKLWQQVLTDLAGVLDSESHHRLFSGSRISGYRNGEIEIEVAASVESKLSAEYRAIVERRLSHHLRRDVTVQFEGIEESAPSVSGPAQNARTPDVVVISRNDAEQARQLWRVVLDGLGTVTRDEERARIAGSLPLGQDPDGTIVIGASSALAARLLNGRCRAAVEASLQAVLGGPHPLRVLEPGRWTVSGEDVQP
jgi:hypothetical protein